MTLQIWAELCTAGLCGVATWTHRKVDQKYLEVLKCGAGEGRRRSCGPKKKVLRRVKEKRKMLHIKRTKAKWICHILSRKCHLKHVIGGKRKDEKTRKKTQTASGWPWGKSEYWKLKPEALYHTVWGTPFGRGYGLIVIQTAWCDIVSESQPWLLAELRNAL